MFAMNTLYNTVKLIHNVNWSGYKCTQNRLCSCV